MKRAYALALMAVAAEGTAFVIWRSAEMLRRLPPERYETQDGVLTVADAIEHCRTTRLRGWDLVAYAQRLTARKFTYSRLNTWESPAHAFERGRGYCEQQALALQQIYDGLGIESWPVFALRCWFPASTVDGMPRESGVTGHAWLRVRVGDEVREVCPHSPENTPGVKEFVVISPVHRLRPWLRPFTRFGSSLENIRRDMVAVRQMKRSAERAGPALAEGSEPIAVTLAPERTRVPA